MTQDYAPLTQPRVESEIMRISNNMEKAVEDLAVLAADAAEAEVAFKVAYAQETLRAGQMEGSGRNGRMTEGDKEATATAACEDLLRKKLITQAHHEVQVESMRSMRSRIDALRTISANLRAIT